MGTRDGMATVDSVGFEISWLTVLSRLAVKIVETRVANNAMPAAAKPWTRTSRLAPRGVRGDHAAEHDDEPETGEEQDQLETAVVRAAR